MVLNLNQLNQLSLNLLGSCCELSLQSFVYVCLLDDVFRTALTVSCNPSYCILLRNRKAVGRMLLD